MEFLKQKRTFLRILLQAIIENFVGSIGEAKMRTI